MDRRWIVSRKAGSHGKEFSSPHWLLREISGSRAGPVSVRRTPDPRGLVGREIDLVVHVTAEGVDRIGIAALLRGQNMGGEVEGLRVMLRSLRAGGFLCGMRKEKMDSDMVTKARTSPAAKSRAVKKSLRAGMLRLLAHEGKGFPQAVALRRRQ